MSNFLFKICKTPVPPQSDSKIKVMQIPQIGDTVFNDDGKSVKLGKELGKGGEGSVYAIGSSLICKIYNHEKLTVYKEKKIKLMLSAKITHPGICWPISAAHNKDGKFVGYFMQLAGGRDMQKTLMLGKPVLIKNFRKWHRVQLVDLCMDILQKIIYLHSMNIIIGDINPLNIRIADDAKSYFIDTDSYQIENYPCPVGTINFTAPEIQKLKYEDYLRTFEHEYFAVATLLFMIMMPGKPPYSQQGGSDPANNIKNMDFSYPFGDKSNHKAPAGPWQFLWSHLSYKLKEAFYNTFKNNKRISPAEWLEILKKYKSSIVEGHLSNEIFPIGFKPISDHALNNYENIKGRNVRCSKCSNKFFLNKKFEESLNGEKPLCEECRQKLNDSYEIIICKICGVEFQFTAGEAQFYKSKQLDKPQKCKKCRSEANNNHKTCNFNGSKSHSSSKTKKSYSGSKPANTIRKQSSSPNIFAKIIKDIFGF